MACAICGPRKPCAVAWAATADVSTWRVSARAATAAEARHPLNPPMSERFPVLASLLAPHLNQGPDMGEA